MVDENYSYICIRGLDDNVLYMRHLINISSIQTDSSICLTVVGVEIWNDFLADFSVHPLFINIIFIRNIPSSKKINHFQLTIGHNEKKPENQLLAIYSQLVFRPSKEEDLIASSHKTGCYVGFAQLRLVLNSIF